MVLTILFFGSGALSLGYQIVWMRLLSLHLGHSAWSITTVVSSFMGGLALGSWLGGRATHKITRPIRVYAWLEGGVGLSALLLIAVLRGLDSPLALLHDALSSPFAFILARALVCFLILLVPTTLMGATLPVLVMALTRKKSFQKAVGALYGINTVGAAVGTLAMGFFILKHLGLMASTYVLAALNLVICVLAMSADKSTGAVPPEPIHTEKFRPNALAVGVFVTGFLSLIHEIGWVRLLTPLLGSSTYTFSLILTLFLIAIGLGSLIVSALKFPPPSLRFFSGFFILCTSLTVLCGLYGINFFPSWVRRLAMWAGDHVVFFISLQSLLIGFLLFIPCLFMGLALPLMITAHKNESGQMGRSVGTLYMINTIGSVCGAALAGFYFLPRLGVETAISGAALAGALFALWFMTSGAFPPKKKKRLVLAIGICAFGLVLFFRPTINQQALQYGSFRKVLKTAGPETSSYPNLIALKNGLLSTVAVYRDPEAISLHINGKADASTRGDLSTQYGLAHVPLFFKPEAKRINIIGYGSGATVRAAASHPVRHIDVVELEPAILEVDPYFHSVNDNVLTDPRVRVHIEDGRTFLRYQKDRYDIIISEPSNPWIEGIGLLFTVDFYELAKERLVENGLLCQWIQTYEISQRTLNTMLQTLHSVFPYAHIFINDGDFIVVASQKPIEGRWASIEKRFRDSSVQPTLERLDMKTPFDLFLGYVHSFPEDSAVYPSPLRNTDDNGWLEFHAPVEMYLGLSPTLTPLPLERYRERFASVCFKGLNIDAVSVGVAEAIARKRPQAHHRIQGLIDAAKNDGTREKLKTFRNAAIRHVEDIEKNAQRLQQVIALIEQGKLSQTIPLLKQALRVEPRQGQLHRLLGLAYQKTGDSAKARTAYQTAVDINPDDYFSNTQLNAL